METRRRIVTIMKRNEWMVDMGDLVRMRWNEI